MKNKTYGRGCPFCSGKAVCQHNTLARNAHEVALFWDAKENHPLSPDQVTVSSNMQAHWRCSVCLYEWQASVEHKARLGAPFVPRQTLASVQMALGRSTLLLQEQSMPWWSNGTMTGMEKTDIFLTTQHHEATSSFGGAAINVPRARCTAGRLVLSRTMSKNPTGCPC